MAAVGSDGVAGRNDAGTVEPTLVDHSLQVDVEEVPTRLHHEAEVADRRETGKERLARVQESSQCAVGRVVLHSVHRQWQSGRCLRSTDDEVELHVHESGQQGDVAEIDALIHVLHQRSRRRRRCGRRRS